MMDYVVAPMTILCDSREQCGYSFTGFLADAKHWIRDDDGVLIKKPPLVIPIKTAALKTGDYSIEGYESRVAVERKNLSDAFSSFSHERDRFERELVRLNKMEFGAVVVEASWSSIMGDPPPHTKFTTKSFFRSWIAWNVKYPRVHWWDCPTKTFAEHVTFRLLEKFWQYDQERLKREQKEAG